MIHLTVSPACPVESLAGGECPLGLGVNLRLDPCQTTALSPNTATLLQGPGVEILPGGSFELRAWRPTGSLQESQRSLPPINRVIIFQSS